VRRPGQAGQDDRATPPPGLLGPPLPRKLTRLRPSSQVGNLDSDKPADIKLGGSNILDEHCHFECTADNKVFLHASAHGIVMVNGLRISPTKPKELHSGFRVILGDWHTFRFKCVRARPLLVLAPRLLKLTPASPSRRSHPEEVRKAREGKPTPLRSPLVDSYDEPGTSSSPATRPDSPASADQAADWSFARREAVSARLNVNGRDVNLDQLPDEELGRLYSSILRVRHSRTASSLGGGSDRPESRMSFMDSVTEDGDDEDDEDRERDGQSGSRRPFSTGTWATDPTSLADSTLTLSHLPDLSIDGDKPSYADDDLPLATPTLSSSSTAAALEQAEADRDKDRRAYDKVKQLEAQLKVQRRRIAKLRSAGAGDSAADELADLLDEWPRLEPAHEPLARKVVAQWRTRRRVRMAEDALSQAVVLKEVNVMSRELKKGVSFQFVAVERDVPSSASEHVAGLGDIDEVGDPALAACLKPCVGVKVLDRRDQVLSIWSLSKLEQRLAQMRNAYKWLDKPEYKRHFAASADDPFHESPPPPGGFSLVGQALGSLVPLARGLPSTQTLQIYSPYIADPIGSCRLRLKPLEIRSPPSSSSTSLVNGASQSNGDVRADDRQGALVEGGTLVVEVVVDSVSGFGKAEFAALHLQLSTATLFGAAAEHDETVSSEPVYLDSTSASAARLKRRLEVTLTPDVLRHLAESHGQVALFARVRLPHFDRIERWDEARDAPTLAKVANAPPVRGDPANGDVTRRPETEFIGQQQHDVLARVEIRELGEAGEYVPVQVVSTNALDSGAFFLRQGIQRRFVLELSHNSGRALAWRRVSKVSLGHVRMLDARGRTHAATSVADVELRGIGTPRPQYANDGIATLSFAAAWDSSVHDSPHLNRSTPSGSRALIRLSFEVDVAGCTSPVPFSMDVAVTISSRDSRSPSKLLTLFNSTKLLSRVSAVFSVVLRPHTTRKPGDVWRLDTSETYVRGEELLAGWKPRGLSLVRDFDSSSAAKRRTADVEGTRAVLEAYKLTLPTVEDARPEDRINLVLAFWQKRFGPTGEVRSLPSFASSCRLHLLTLVPAGFPRARAVGRSCPRPLGAVTGFALALAAQARRLVHPCLSLVRPFRLLLLDEYECLTPSLPRAQRGRQQARHPLAPARPDEQPVAQVLVRPAPAVPFHLLVQLGGRRGGRHQRVDRARRAVARD